MQRQTVYLLIILCIQTLGVFGQEREISNHPAFKADIRNLPVSISTFIPVDFTAIDTVYGDLNRDKYTDLLLVLKRNGEDTTSEEYKRTLMLLLGQEDKSFKLAAQNDNVVYCVTCGGIMGDPYIHATIKNGYFSIEHYGGSAWRWTRIITFKYSPADKYWYLHKDGGDSFNANEPEKVATTVKTVKDFGKVPFDMFNIYAE